MRKANGRGLTSLTEVPSLFQPQEESFNRFGQQDKTEGRKDIGLQAMFSRSLAMKLGNSRIRITYLRYTNTPPLLTEKESRDYNLTYAAPLHLHLQVIMMTNESVVSEEEELIFLGDFPIMTLSSTFVISGTDRVVISGLHRAPGLYVEKKEEGPYSRQLVKIIPQCGPHINFQLGRNSVVCSRIDSKRETPITVMFSSIGLTEKDLWELFGQGERLFITRSRCYIGLTLIDLRATTSKFPIIDDNGRTIVSELEVIDDTKTSVLRAESVTDTLIYPKTITNLISYSRLSGLEEKVLLDLKSRMTTTEILGALRHRLINCISITPAETSLYQDFLSKTLTLSKTTTTTIGCTSLSSINQQREIPKTNNNNAPITYAKESLEEKFRRMFPSITKFSLAEVGRKSLSRKILMPDSYGPLVLSCDDIVLVLKYLAKVNHNVPEPDDLDHLNGKIIYQVGELLERQLTAALPWLEQPIGSIVNQCANSNKISFNFAGIRPISTSLKDFFVSSHLSQLLDYTNPLARITHTRRLSSLALSTSGKQHTNLDIRDVHYSHYGKICPVETPEGQSIGLVSSLTAHAKVGSDGTLRTPYRSLRGDNVNDEMVYLSALEEESYIITTYASQCQGELLARKAKDMLLVSKDEVHYADAAQSQIVSIATAMIPFLEHNDVNRALMGSNMQRQVVPCFSVERPIVSTGIERDVASDSQGHITVGKPGEVTFSGPGKIIVQTAEEKDDVNTDIYDLSYFADPYHNIFANYLSVVSNSTVVGLGDTIADSFSTDGGWLSLGTNVLVAFMPWGGFNFEDSVIVSERLVSEGKYTSAQLEEFVVTVQHTKILKEKTTRTIRGKRVEGLDVNGIISKGSVVAAGDVLVGKLCPKNAQSVTPEEKLLCAIFNESLLRQKDTSSYVPHDILGTVIDVRVTDRIGSQNRRTTTKVTPGIWEDNYNQQERRMFGVLRDTLLVNHQNNQRLTVVDPYEWLLLLVENQWTRPLRREHAMLVSIRKRVRQEVISRKNNRESRELPLGVTRLIKIVLLVEKNLQPGDKMSGRHGNKGVVSKIAPTEDMPHLKDGQPIDIVLNPLGVPSRMNIGQILETHLSLLTKLLSRRMALMLCPKGKNSLGWCSDILYQVHSDPGRHEYLLKCNAKEKVKLKLLTRRGVALPVSPFGVMKDKTAMTPLSLAASFKADKRMSLTTTRDQVFLTDGNTGEEHLLPTTVGHLYYFKLHHLVEDKMHARSLGPYSAVTQQPLGGKAQFGGQRLGEMEVWALEAYGAAYNLQEMLTTKSDDIWGRLKMYENIITGNLALNAGTPESFNVLVREVRALGIDLNAERQ